jgi:H+/gluconate symporter-like permease
MGSMFVFFETVAPNIIAKVGVNLGVVHRLTTMTATTIDSLPHNGSIFMTLYLYGYSHKGGYKYLFVSSRRKASGAYIVWNSTSVSIPPTRERAGRKNPVMTLKKLGMRMIK